MAKRRERAAHSGSPSGDALWGLSTAAAVLFVAAIAAVVSFIHIQHLALTHGQTMLAATLLPFSIDGTVVAASLVLLRAARRGISAPWLAQVMLGSAVLATLAANIGYGWSWGVAGALLSGWPAYAFIGCAEMAILMVRRTAKPVSARVSASRPTEYTQRRIMAEVGVGQDKARAVQRLLRHAAASGLSPTGDRDDAPSVPVTLNGDHHG